MIELKPSDNSCPNAATINVYKRCSDCRNANICKYSEEYTSYMDKVDSEGIPVMLKIDITCKYFSPVIQAREEVARKNPKESTRIIIQGRNRDKRVQ